MHQIVYTIQDMDRVQETIITNTGKFTYKQHNGKMNEKDFVLLAVEGILTSYFESRTDKARAMEESRQLTEGLHLSMNTTEAILNAEKAFGDPETIDVGDEEHTDPVKITFPDELAPTNSEPF